MVSCICLIVYHIAHCLSTPKACDLASNWSLVVNFYVINLVACRVAGCTMCGGGNIFFSGILSGHASDWLLATGSNAVVLVTCMVACIESGVPGKVCPGKVNAASSSNERSHNLDRSFRNSYIIPSFPTREQHARSVQNARSRFNKLNQSYSC